VEIDYGRTAKLSLVRVAEQRPLVHHVTNWVSANDVANLTLAYGALPVMATGREEVAEMAASARALVLNLGTPSRATLEAMLAAGRAAAEHGVPIVLDPVGAGATSFRTEGALHLLAELPVTVLRGNRGEIGALLGGGAVRGVEAVGDEDAREVAQEAAQRFGVVAAVTGPVDVVAGGGSIREVRNGDPLLAAITGSGCMATAAVAVMLTAGEDPNLQAALALATFGLAAERAASGSRGPGTFRPRLLDAVAALHTQGVDGLRITEPAG
jgi:hydroxyethylthiazole kinase